MVILIPARGGSKRIPGKALKELGGKPLIQWAWESVQDLGAPAYIASESHDILVAGGKRFQSSSWDRPMWTATDDAPDITWLSLALSYWPNEDLFMVRRPTSPFLRRATIARAMGDFAVSVDATAMRAMRPVTEHPCKMWLRDGIWMRCPGDVTGGVESCSVPTQLLPRVYVQTAGLEIIRRSTLEAGSLTGNKLLPLFLEGPEALDINTPEDWARAEEIAKTWIP